MVMQQQEQQQQMYQQQQYDAPVPANNRVRPTLSFPDHLQRFTIDGVDRVHNLDVDSKLLAYEVTKDQETPGRYHVDFEAEGKDHDVGVTYEGQHIEGSPFQLVAAQQELPRAHHNDAENCFTVSNVPNAQDHLRVKGNVGYSMFTDKNNNNTVHIDYKAKGITDVSLVYKDQEIEGGQFRLIPNEMKDEFFKAQKTAALEDSMSQLKISEKSAQQQQDEGYASGNEDPEDEDSMDTKTQPNCLYNEAGKCFTVRNVPNANERLSVKGKVGYVVTGDKEENDTVHIDFDSQGIQDVSLNYDGQMIHGGQLRLIPKELKAIYENASEERKNAMIDQDISPRGRVLMSQQADEGVRLAHEDAVQQMQQQQMSEQIVADQEQADDLQQVMEDVVPQQQEIARANPEITPNGDGTFTVSNVPNAHNLVNVEGKLDYQMADHETDQDAVKIRFNKRPGNLDVQDVKITYADKEIAGGNMRLIPHELKSNYLANEATDEQPEEEVMMSPVQQEEPTTVAATTAQAAVHQQFPPASSVQQQPRAQATAATMFRQPVMSNMHTMRQAMKPLRSQPARFQPQSAQMLNGTALPVQQPVMVNLPQHQQQHQPQQRFIPVTQQQMQQGWGPVRVQPLRSQGY